MLYPELLRRYHESSMIVHAIVDDVLISRHNVSLGQPYDG